MLQLDKEQLEQLITLSKEKARLETSLKSHQDTIARLTNANNTLELSERTLNSRVEQLQRELNESKG